MNKKVSVIVPAYNVEEYIENCIISIIQQTYTNIEIIIIDDGSTDSTGKICDRLAKADKRINVIHQKNQGLSQARNNGIKASTSNYISLIDGDDVINKNFLQNIMSSMKSGVDIVVSGYKVTNSCGKILSTYRKKDTVLTGKEATIELLIKQEDFFVIAWNKIYKKELFVKNNIWYPSGRIHEDNLTTYKLLSKAKKVAVVDAADYLYIKRAGSITSTSKKELQVQEKINASKEAMIFFKDKDMLEAASYSLFLARIIELNETIRQKKMVQYKPIIKEILEIDLSDNKYCTLKSKTYLCMLRFLSGRAYIMFRKFADKAQR